MNILCPYRFTKGWRSEREGGVATLGGSNSPRPPPLSANCPRVGPVSCEDPDFARATVAHPQPSCRVEMDLA